MPKTETLPSPFLLKQQLPRLESQGQFVENYRSQIRDILSGKDSRILLIIGPCSIHDLSSAKQYAIKLKELAKEVENSFLILMRVHFEKPRTTTGWKGYLYDPDLNKSNNIAKGIYETRKLLLELANLELPASCEFLDPASPLYFGDLICWGCIGARTASSQIHRQIASTLDIPIGFKNSTDGNIAHAVNGVLSAGSSHSFIGTNEKGRLCQITSRGNPYCRVILRGGESKSNYDPQSIAYAQKLLREAKLPEKLIIDCSHDNCSGVYEHQRTVFHSIINQHIEGNDAICGMMVESHLLPGSQNINNKELTFGISITDPCIDWSMTEQLIYWGHQKLLQKDLQTSTTPQSNLCIVE